MPDRIKYIGGSDAGKIWRGEWKELWEIKTGRTRPEDLSLVFRVQLGLCTENFNARWFSETLDLEVKQKIEFVADDFRGGHVDGLTEDNGILECKHTHSFNPTENLVKYYYPQIQHYLSLYPERTHCWLSVIKGNEFFPLKINRDNKFIENLIELETTFWEHCQSDRAPDDPDFNTDKKINWDDIAINDLIVKDMSGSNSWSEGASKFLETKEAVEINTNVKKLLKELVPNNVREAYGSGIRITRNKKGSLTIKSMEGEAYSTGRVKLQL